MVSKALQDAVWKAYRGTTAEERAKSIPYMSACADAVEYVARLEGKDEANPYRRIVNNLIKIQEAVK